MKVFILCAWLFYGSFAVCLAGSSPQFEALSDEMIQYVNSLDTTWKAARSPRFEGMTAKDVTRMCGSLTDGPTSPIKQITPPKWIPESFDAREAWPHCSTISNIGDQGSCGSCWAFGAVGCMSDRYCIKYNEIVNISAADLLSCCGNTCGYGCCSGYPKYAWEYWATQGSSVINEGGIVTGGAYGSGQGCQPYTLPNCNHHEPGPYQNCTFDYRTPNCKKECISEYSKSYEEDKHFGLSHYTLRRVAEEVQTEIMTNGPVEAVFDVYADFPTYSSGVYQHVAGCYVGGHAVKILGWGKDTDGTPYWLAANSWNTNWGEKGYFKILRGKNECKILNFVFAGEPKQYNLI